MKEFEIHVFRGKVLPFGLGCRVADEFCRIVWQASRGAALAIFKQCYAQGGPQQLGVSFNL